MICCICGRTLKRASATTAAGAIGPKCARKASARASDLFPEPFDLDRACVEATARVDAFVEQRYRQIRREVRDGFAVAASLHAVAHHLARLSAHLAAA